MVDLVEETTKKISKQKPPAELSSAKKTSNQPPLKQ